jgi:GxxExxY protein
LGVFASFVSNLLNEAATDGADMESADPTNRIIGLAIKVHRKLGPGLLESIYGECLCWELAHVGLPFRRLMPLPVIYEGMRLNCAYYADIIVDQSVLLELKSVERILPVHEARTLTYLRLSGCRIGLLMNFNSVMLKDGLRRFIA